MLCPANILGYLSAICLVRTGRRVVIPSIPSLVLREAPESPFDVPHRLSWRSSRLPCGVRELTPAVCRRVYGVLLV